MAKVIKDFLFRRCLREYMSFCQTSDMESYMQCLHDWELRYPKKMTEKVIKLVSQKDGKVDQSSLSRKFMEWLRDL